MAFKYTKKSIFEIHWMCDKCKKKVTFTNKMFYVDGFVQYEHCCPKCGAVSLLSKLYPLYSFSKCSLDEIPHILENDD